MISARAGVCGVTSELRLDSPGTFRTSPQRSVSRASWAHLLAASLSPPTAYLLRHTRNEPKKVWTALPASSRRTAAGSGSRQFSRSSSSSCLRQISLTLTQPTPRRRAPGWVSEPARRGRTVPSSGVRPAASRRASHRTPPHRRQVPVLQLACKQVALIYSLVLLALAQRTGSTADRPAEPRTVTYRTAGSRPWQGAEARSGPAGRGLGLQARGGFG